MARDDGVTAVCPCGAEMRWEPTTKTWACLKTLDAEGWGRPKKGHTHYFAEEDRVAGRAPTTP